MYYYSKELNAVLITLGENDGFDFTKIAIDKKELLRELPDVIYESDKEALLTSLAFRRKINKDVLDNCFDEIYQKTQDFYYRGRLTVVYMCEYVLKNRFQAGYKINDGFEAERFRQFMTELFGDKAYDVTNRAIDAKVGEIGVLCDRGKYIHPDYLEVDQRVIDSINEYVEESPRSVLTYGEVYEALKDNFIGTQITNRYWVQGALKKYGCKYSTGRDYIRKTQSISFIDEFELFVEERGIVHKSEIFAEFTSIGETGRSQVSARSENVYNIDEGYYIHISQFDIQPDDYEAVRRYLNEACRDVPVNIRTVYDVAAERFPDLMYRNDFDSIYKLYAALNYMFRNEFSFSRPYIAKLGTSDVTNKTVLLQHIKDYDTIEIDDLIDICNENNIRYLASSYIIQMIMPEYIRISQTTLMRRELTGITDDMIDAAVQAVNEALEVNDYIAGARFNDFLWFPQAEVDWNEFLLESVIILSKKISIVNLIGDPLKHPNVVYVSDKYKNETFNSFLVKILTDKVRNCCFRTKSEMRDWLREEMLIEGKLPKILYDEKYFYADEHGVHCVHSD